MGADPARAAALAATPARAAFPVFAWGVGGVVLMLVVSVWRLSGHAAGMFAHPLGPIEVIAAIGWAFFMVYAEGWRGFHKQFSPRVVRRAMEMPRSPHLMALAPVVCMGMLHATRKRLIVSWCLLVGIVGIVLVIRQLEQPWRGIVDLGVVLGLGSGTASILWYTSRALLGQPPEVDPDWPVA